MNTAPAYLSAPRYVLGETEADHTSIANLTARAREFGMPPKAALWGWGTVRRTAKSLEALAVESGATALTAVAFTGIALNRPAPAALDVLVAVYPALPATANPAEVGLALGPGSEVTLRGISGHEPGGWYGRTEVLPARDGLPGAVTAVVSRLRTDERLRKDE
ncbi:hypothetical protein [Streptomyces violens]|uniref:hypothetical protein n=1 Tax=Streptomyces violens TaxID=66377 RepID=UPI0004C02828|nr:hypothetical protein [Streptomyces violens]